jgi:hypothetical protein
VQGALLAAVHPGDTPAGYNLTFAFPMLMFIIVAGALYLRFRGSHDVPGHVALTSSRWAAGGTGTVKSGEDPVHASVEPEPTPETEAHLVEAVPAEAEGTAEPAAAAGPEATAEAEPAEQAKKDTEDGE